MVSAATTLAHRMVFTLSGCLRPRVYSLKTGSKFGRSRGYWESDTFGHCNLSAVPAWTAGADVDDDMMVGTSKKQTAQLYNVRRLDSTSLAAGGC